MGRRGRKNKRKAGIPRFYAVSQTPPPSFPTRYFPYDEEEDDQSNHSNHTISEWVVNINDCLENGRTYDSGRSWNIHRVPTGLRQIHKNAFVPKIVSIGPLNYWERESEKRLQVMEEHKMRFLLRLLGGKCDGQNGRGEESAGNQNNDGCGVPRSVCLQNLVNAMKELEHEARACYSESFDDEISSLDFVQMLVVDGCFIVQLLHLYYEEAQGHAFDDPIFTTPWMLKSLQRDLLMLENQLPFSVLEKLYMLIYQTDPEVPLVSLEVLAVTFFDPLLPREEPASKLNTPRRYTHLLDIFRSTFLKSVREKAENGKVQDREWQPNPAGSIKRLARERQLTHFTSELQEAGVNFRRRKCSDLLDIAFEGDTLRIPPLSINDDTVLLFLNFVAYEQCNELAKPFFSSYFMFLDSLVNSPHDVQILHKHHIINHALGGNDDVTGLLHKLCREIVYDVAQCYLYGEMKKVNEYCKPFDNRWYRKWWRNFMHKYFSSPWTFFSLLGAIFLLLLTILQTIYIVYTYYGTNFSGLQRFPLKFFFRTLSLPSVQEG